MHGKAQRPMEDLSENQINMRPIQTQNLTQTLTCPKQHYSNNVKVRVIFWVLYTINFGTLDSRC